MKCMQLCVFDVVLNGFTRNLKINILIKWVCEYTITVLNVDYLKV